MKTPGSLTALVTGIVDYAGLFPPAALDMRSAVENYARYLDDENAWMLGRFVVPEARAGEFLDAAARHLSSAREPWRLSAVVGDDVEPGLARIASFNRAHEAVAVDVVEVKGGSAEAIGAVARSLPAGLRAFVEVPIAEDPAPLVRALAASSASKRLRAKVRTGGVTPGTIPRVEDIARFIRACYASNVAFKATAGLHHPLRGDHALTYEAGSERAVMHGFLNVFLAAAFCFNGLGATDAPRVVALETSEGLHFDDDGVSWEEYRVSTAEIATVRRRFALSFGSCSFTEPVEGLVALGLLR
jgi:hypothetical protein